MVAENTNDLSVLMMASSICALVFDFTSEEALLNHPDLSSSCLNSLSRLIARSLASWGQVNADAMCVYACYLLVFFFFFVS